MRKIDEEIENKKKNWWKNNNDNLKFQRYKIKKVGEFSKGNLPEIGGKWKKSKEKCSKKGNLIVKNYKKLKKKQRN